MNPRHLLALALALLVIVGVLMLQGCAHTIDSYPPQPRMVSPVNTAIESVPVTVRWHQTANEVSDACPPPNSQWTYMVYGCATLHLSPFRCVIHAQVPKDFNDVPALAILGHELAHCFLAMH